jgi:hypothetical protein
MQCEVVLNAKNNGTTTNKKKTIEELLFNILQPNQI